MPARIPLLNTPCSRRACSALHTRWLCVRITETGERGVVGEKRFWDFLNCAPPVTLRAQGICDTLCRRLLPGLCKKCRLCRPSDHGCAPGCVRRREQHAHATTVRHWPNVVFRGVWTTLPPTSLLRATESGEQGTMPDEIRNLAGTSACSLLEAPESSACGGTSKRTDRMSTLDTARLSRRRPKGGQL